MFCKYLNFWSFLSFSLLRNNERELFLWPNNLSASNSMDICIQRAFKMSPRRHAFTFPHDFKIQRWRVKKLFYLILVQTLISECTRESGNIIYGHKTQIFLGLANDKTIESPEQVYDPNIKKFTSRDVEGPCGIHGVIFIHSEWLRWPSHNKLSLSLSLPRNQPMGPFSTSSTPPAPSLLLSSRVDRRPSDWGTYVSTAILWSNSEAPWLTTGASKISGRRPSFRYDVKRLAEALQFADPVFSVGFSPVKSSTSTKPRMHKFDGDYEGY